MSTSRVDEPAGPPAAGALPSDDATVRGAHRTEIQMRFSDTDALGHVNNASFALYAETARVDFLRLIESGVRSLILAHLAIDFRRQVKFGDDLQVDTEVERVGHTSVTLRQRVLANGEVAAEVGSVVVLFDYAAQRPVPLPESARAQLARYRPPPVPATD